MDRSPHSVPNWSLLLYMRTPNLHSLIGLKGTVLIGQNRATPVGQSCTADWIPEGLLLVGTGFQNLLYKGWLSQQKESRPGFSLKYSFLRDSCVETSARLFVCLFNLSTGVLFYFEFEPS